MRGFDFGFGAHHDVARLIEQILDYLEAVLDGPELFDGLAPVKRIVINIDICLWLVLGWSVAPSEVLFAAGSGKNQPRGSARDAGVILQVLLVGIVLL